MVTKKAQSVTRPEVSFTCQLASQGSGRYSISVPRKLSHLLEKGRTFQVVLRPVGTLR